jgi:1-acyl-sn-glycerol-3-phosphate acyltransferase
MSAPREPAARRLLRRAVTLPLYAVLFAGVLAGLPLLAIVAAALDLVRGVPWVALRCVLFFAWYLACEVAGVLAACALWLASGTLWRRRPERARDALYHLQALWARALFAGGRRVFGFRLEVDGADALGPGPLVVLIRHASVADTLLPAVVLGDRAGWRLRYVLKSELLWDPCLDLVGNRLPNTFVRRDSPDGEREIAAVVALLDDAGPRDGVLIYPEGTRFSVAKRERVLRRIAAGGDADALDRARRFRFVLPPRPGGALGLLDHPARADVLFVAHHGFDRAATFWDFWNGGLVGRSIRVALWHVPHADLPAGREKRALWLHEQWMRVDAWIAEQRAGEDGRAGGTAG